MGSGNGVMDIDGQTSGMLWGSGFHFVFASVKEFVAAFCSHLEFRKNFPPKHVIKQYCHIFIGWIPVTLSDA